MSPFTYSMSAVFQNNLVDSLEFLSSFAMLSGMTPDEKIRCKLEFESYIKLTAY